MQQAIEGALAALLLRAVAAGKIETVVRASELLAENPNAFELTDCRRALMDAMTPGDEEVIGDEPYGDLAVSYYLPRI